MTRATPRYYPVLIALSVIVATFSGVALTATPTSAAPTEIDSCTTITESGTYTLTTDIENSDGDSCILIEASDVTFDGNGHTIDGTDADRTRGVEVASDNNDVTIRDLTVTDWEIGVYSSISERATVSGVTAESNFVGLFFEESSENTVTDTTAVNNEGDGISFFISDENTLSNVTANGNGGNGFSFDDSAFNDLDDVTATDNDAAGFAFSESAQNTVTDAVAMGNQKGFDLFLVGNTTIENALVTDNTEAAFESDSVLGLDPETNTVREFETDSATISFTEIKDTSAFNHALTINAVESAPDDPDDLRNVGQYVEVSESAPDAAPSVELDVQYDDEDVEDAGVDEESLRLYTYADGEWTEVPDSSVDTEANVVSGTVDEVNDETLVVAPLGRPADEQSDDGVNDGDDEQTQDDSDNGDDADDSDQNEGSDDKQDDGNDADKNDQTEQGNDDGQSQQAGEGTAGGDKSTNHDETDGNSAVEVGRQDIAIDFDEIVIADLHLEGPGLPDTEIDERTYRLSEHTITVDGFTIAIGDTTYRIGHTTITIDGFAVTLQDVSLEDTTEDSNRDTTETPSDDSDTETETPSDSPPVDDEVDSFTTQCGDTTFRLTEIGQRVDSDANETVIHYEVTNTGNTTAENVTLLLQGEMPLSVVEENVSLGTIEPGETVSGTEAIAGTHDDGESGPAGISCESSHDRDSG